MKVTVHNISKTPIPVVFDNVIQADYTCVEEHYWGQTVHLSILQDINGAKVKTLLDLVPDVQITFLNDIPEGGNTHG